MTKHEKLLSKIRNNPTDVKFETLQKLLLEYGFKERQPKSGSSHYTYTRGDTIITVPRHKPVNKIYVKQVIKLIDDIEALQKLEVPYEKGSEILSWSQIPLSCP